MNVQSIRRAAALCVGRALLLVPGAFGTLQPDACPGNDRACFETLVQRTSASDSRRVSGSIGADSRSWGAGNHLMQ